MNMKKSILFALLTGAFVMTSCSSDDDVIADVNTDSEFTILAKLPQTASTRMTGVDTSDGSGYGMKFSWESTDQVRFYYWALNKDTQQNTYQVFDRPLSNKDKLEDDGGIGKFKLGTRPNQNCNVYASWGKFSVSDFTVPDAAAATATVFVNSDERVYDNVTDVTADNPMFGVVSYTSPKGSVEYNEMTFAPVHALLKLMLSFPEEVTSISEVSIQKWNGTKATNPITRRYYKITGSSGSIESLVDASHDETTASGGYKVTSKSFTVTDKKITLYALVHPQDWDGISITVKDNSSNTYTYTSTGSNTLKVGEMYGIKAKLTKQ